jgi:L-amino acid N-acyltransferase YncA
MEFAVEEMQLHDWKAVVEIYTQGLATGQATFETHAPSWEQWDANHIRECRLVARANGVVLGWAALSLVSRRSVYAGVAEVSIYISSSARGQGVGRALMKVLINRSEDHGYWTLQSSVFPENIGSVALHLNHGFREIGRRKRIAKLAGVWRDTVMFERRSLLVGAD